MVGEDDNSGLSHEPIPTWPGCASTRRSWNFSAWLRNWKMSTKTSARRRSRLRSRLRSQMRRPESGDSASGVTLYSDCWRANVPDSTWRYLRCPYLGWDGMQKTKLCMPCRHKKGKGVDCSDDGRVQECKHISGIQLWTHGSSDLFWVLDGSQLRRVYLSLSLSLYIYIYTYIYIYLYI